MRLSVTQSPTVSQILPVSVSHTAPTLRPFFPSLGHTQPHRSAHSVRLLVTPSTSAPHILSDSRLHTAQRLCKFCPSLGVTKPHRCASIFYSVGQTQPYLSAHSVRLSVTHNPTAPHILSVSRTHTPTAPHILPVSRSDTAPTLRTFFSSLGHTQPHPSVHSIRFSDTIFPTATHFLYVSPTHTAPPLRTFSPSLGHTQPQRSASLSQSLGHTQTQRSTPSVHLPVTQCPTAPHILSVSRSHKVPPLRLILPVSPSHMARSLCIFSPSLGNTQPHRSAHSVSLSVTHNSTAPHILSVSRSHTPPPIRLIQSVSRSHRATPLRTFSPSLGHTQFHRSPPHILPVQH